MAYLGGGYAHGARSPELTVAKANEYVQELVTTMQNNLARDCGITVTEVVKSGSLGQGTAIPGDFDLDLVFYSQDIDPNIAAEQGVGSIVKKLVWFLNHHFGRSCTNMSTTEHGVSFTFHGEIEVDLLPSPFWQSKEEFHAFLSRSHNRRMFSCSAAKWEKYFFQEQRPQVKEYIKRAKAWRNEKWPKKQNGDGRPKSILIGVLMAEAYRKSHYSDPASITAEFKKLVKNHLSLRIDLAGDGARYASPPYILDPANPYNNLYISGIGQYKANSSEGTYGPGDGNWANFKYYIDTLDLSRAV